MSRGQILLLLPDHDTHYFMENQIASPTPPLSYLPEYDPNAQKNRIPTESELSGLRILAETLSRSIENAKEDIKRTQAMHDTLLATHQRQLRELEGTQSQLQESKRILRLIEDQLISLEAERSRVAGITHPIRRCPSEVLQCIFEITCDQEETRDKIWRAFGLSQVCQRWRFIAVNTARLWCSIEYTISNNEATNASFWRCVTPRMKRVPANVILHDLEINGARKILQCNLAQIPVINRASFNIPNPDYFDLIASLPRFLPEDGVNRFELVCLVEGVDELSEAYGTVWDIGTLLRGFPLLSNLSLTAPCILCVTPTENLEAVTTLYLRDMLGVDVPHILCLFTHLSTLELSEVDFAESEITTLTVTRSLQFLMIENSSGEYSWITGISCPELTSFILNGAEFDEWVNFIQGHSSIVNLEFDGDNEALVKLATVAPQIESLTISSSVEAFINWKDNEMTSPPFTLLKHLTFMGYESVLTLAQFEGIATGRCLPAGANRSEVAPDMLPLETLSIVYDPMAASRPADERWRDSELFKSARRHVAPHSYWDDVHVITLSWA